ncbi:MAG: Gfo/Idh/MocA family protein [Armatimonadota bacterium]
MSDTLTMGIVGCGGMAGAHCKGLRELWDADIRDIRIVATCDVEEGRARNMADELGAWQGARPSVYSDVEAMLSGEKDMMAVDICSVHRNHHTLAIPCFEAGKHVTIEKPLAITLRAGRLMLDAAQKAGTVFQVAENYRRAPEQRAINWAIKQGRIGAVRMIFWIDVSERLWYWTWREHREQAGGGWVLDGGVHFADLFRYHVGEARRVWAQTRQFNPVRYRDEEKREGRVEVDVEDTVVAMISFEDDVLGQWTSTTAAPGQKWSRRVIYGEDGAIDWGAGLKSRTEELSIEQLVKQFRESLSDEESERLFPGGVTNTVATELHEFAQAVFHDGQVETDGLSGYKAEAICVALYESAATGGPVDLADIEALRIEEYQRDLNEGLGLASE